jgi:hypothetical protein
MGQTAVETVEESVTLGEADGKSVRLHFSAPPRVAAKVDTPPVVSQPLSAEPAASSAPSSRSILSYAALGVGGAGLMVGGVPGFLALRERKALDDAATAATTGRPRLAGITRSGSRRRRPCRSSW